MKVYYVVPPNAETSRWSVCVREEGSTVGIELSQHNTSQTAHDVAEVRRNAAIAKRITNKRLARKPDNKIAWGTLKSAFESPKAPKQPTNS